MSIKKISYIDLPVSDEGYLDRVFELIKASSTDKISPSRLDMMIDAWKRVYFQSWRVTTEIGSVDDICVSAIK